MIDEKGLNQEKKWYYETRARSVIKNLLKRDINSKYAASRREALAVVMEMIPPGVTVARGDSIGVDQVGVPEELVKLNRNRLINPVERDQRGSFVYSTQDRYRLALLVGMRKAKEIVLTGKRLSGKEAEQLGLVNLAVPPDKLESAIDEMVSQLSDKSPVAMRLSKWFINKVSMLDAETRLELAIMYSLIDAASEDKEEGMRAFIEKRKPVFKGR
jgi:hypothetical protein